MKKLKLLLVLVAATFSSYAQNYDTPEGAIEINHQDGWSSGDEAYSNVGSTQAGPAGTCGTGYNRWFKFTATASYINLQIIAGTASYLSFAIFEESTMNQVGCLWSSPHSATKTFESNTLIIGQTYLFYVATDGQKKGTFGLSVSTSYNYNYFEGALQVPHALTWNSQNEEYSGAGATQEGPVSTCGSSRNRWFKFLATSENINIDVIAGTGNYFGIALFDSDQSTQLACAYTSPHKDIKSLSYDALQIGQHYYFSVANGSLAGTFSLSISGGANLLWQLSEDVIHPIKLENRVGIGTTAVPDGYQLAIDGKAIMEEVKVQLSENWLWPDYVFEEGYDLRTLKEIKAYISENKHLPDVPAAQEVQAAGGIEIGAMNALLLQKIEELTLHMIEMNKRVHQLEQENIALKESNQRLQREVSALKNE